jgi:hypothetical protein
VRRAQHRGPQGRHGGAALGTLVETEAVPSVAEILAVCVHVLALGLVLAVVL